MSTPYTRNCPQCKNVFDYKNGCCGCFICPKCNFYYNCNMRPDEIYKIVNKNMTIYYSLIIDNSTQWFSYLIKYVECDPMIKQYHIQENYLLDSDMERYNQFISNIYSRPFSFNNVRFDIPGDSNQTFNGIHISEKEFNRVKKMIDLWPKVVEYNKLKTYE